MASYVSAGCNAFNASTVGGTGTTAKVFPALVYPNAGLNSVTASTPGPLTCGIPANGQYEQQIFKVYAAGKVFIHGASPTLLWKMGTGTSMTDASNTNLLTMSALTGLTTNATYPWAWQSVFQGDSTSGVLQAVSSTLWVNNATAGTITLTGLSSGFNATAQGPANIFGPGYTTSGSNSNCLNLVLSLTFGVSDALNKGYCSQFVVVAD